MKVQWTDVFVVALLTMCLSCSAALAQRATPLQLVQSDGAANDRFGHCVAMSQTSSTISISSRHSARGAESRQQTGNSQSLA